MRFLLNTFYSGPQAWFFVADDMGYFRDEGLSITFTEGDTLARAVPRVASGEFEVGYGDLNALVELAAALPEGTPSPVMAVFAMHNATPYTVAVPADSSIKTPRDLVGATLASHPNDAALKFLPELALHCGFEATDVKIGLCADPHPAMIRRLLADAATDVANHASTSVPSETRPTEPNTKSRWQGVFGFVNTLKAAAIEAGIDPATSLRFIEYQHHLPDLYGAALMGGRQFLDREPSAVHGLVRAVNRGLIDTIADPVAAIDAVARRSPKLDRAANLARLKGTLALEMAHPDGARLGLGEVDHARLARAARLIATAKTLPRVPRPDELFSNKFLPPLDARVTNLARNVG